MTLTQEKLVAKNRKTGAWLITISTVVQTLGYLIALPGHLGESSWSAHAQFHHVLGFLWLVGLNGLLMVITWGPGQEGKRWSLWAMLVSFFWGQGSYFLSILVVWEGRPGQLWQHLVLAANLLIGAAGLGIIWRRAR